MQITPQQISALKVLNDKIHQEEIRAKNLCLKLNNQLTKMVQKKEISDFEFWFEYSAFSNDDEFNRKQNVETGDPFIENKYAILSWDDEEFFNDNWNEAQWNEHSPIKDIPFCYTMHCLYFHTDFSIEELLAIEDFWLEVRVTYQFFSEFKQEDN